MQTILQNSFYGSTYRGSAMLQALFQAPKTQQWSSEQNVSDRSSPEAYILE